MSVLLTVLIVAVVIIAIAALVSYMRRARSEDARNRARLAVEAEEHQGAANTKLRRAEGLTDEAGEHAAEAGEHAAKADEHASEAERLEREAAEEVEAARTDEERSIEAREEAGR